MARCAGNSERDRKSSLYVGSVGYTVLIVLSSFEHAHCVHRTTFVLAAQLKEGMTSDGAFGCAKDCSFRFQLNWLSTLRAPEITKVLYYRSLQAAAWPFFERTSSTGMIYYREMCH